MIQQSDLPQAFGAAVEYHRTGRLQDAEALYRDVLAASPNHVDALHLLGVLSGQTGRHLDAIDLIGKAISRSKAKPVPVYHHNLGLAYLASRQPDQAARSFARAVSLKADYAEAHYGLGNAYVESGRHADALAAYGKALDVRPNYAEALNNRGNLLCGLRQYDAALADFDQALAIVPNYPQALNNRGTVMQRIGRADLALLAFDRAVALDPNDPNILSNRAELLEQTGRVGAGIADLERLLSLAPDYPFALGDMVLWKQQLCDWSGLPEARASIVEGVRAGAPVTPPFAALAVPMTPEDHLRCAQIYVARKYPPQPSLWRGQRYNHDRIRIAYVSGDFKTHATAFLMAELFERHDRTKFEIFAISLSPSDNSPIRRRLEAAFEHFVDCSRKSDLEIAEAMRAWEIDIAVDLKGFTTGCPLGIFAHRPAPIQASYLGFAGPVGAPYIDYIVADDCVLPPEDRPFYTEKVVSLPDTYQVTDSRRTVSELRPSRADVGLPEEGIVLCCFNNSFKYAPETFEIWMSLLREVEGSVLWLYATQPDTAQLLWREAEALGIDPARLVFAPPLAQELHIARLGLADLFLDTLPYNAHTTASDSLWAGVPVVTCKGNAFQGRVAASLLTAAGMPELIANSLEDYRALALELARDPARLAGLKAKLAAGRDSCALFDADRFRRHIEAAYTTMVERQRSGKPPAEFKVAPINAEFARA